MAVSNINRFSHVVVDAQLAWLNQQSCESYCRTYPQQHIVKSRPRFRFCSAQVQVDLMMIRARAGLVRARTGLVNRLRGLAKSYGERLQGCKVRNLNPEKAEGLSPELQRALEPLLSAIEELSERICEYDDRIEALAQAGYPQAELLKQIQRSGHADRADLSADAGRSASLRQEPRRGRLSGAAAGAKKLGREIRRCISARKGIRICARCWRKEPSPLWTEAAGTWWKKRKEGGHCGYGKKAGGVVASLVGERRGVRDIAQQQQNDSYGNPIKTKQSKTKSKSFQEEKRQKPKAEFR